MKLARAVILNFNSADYTLRLIRDLRCQCNCNLEIVVVDNASDRNDINCLLNGLDSDVYLVQSKFNGGYAAGNNLGLRLHTNAVPDYYIVLNSDLIIQDKFFVSKLLKSFELDIHQEVMAASPLVRTLHTESPVGYQYQVRRLLSLNGFIIVHLSFFRFFFRSLFETYLYFDSMPFDGRMLLCDTINGASFVIRADVLEQINYLDEGTFLYMEELILGKQIQAIGGVCILNGFCVVDHYQGLTTGSTKSNFKLSMELYKLQSFMYFLKKYFKVNSFLLGFVRVLKIFEIGLLILIKKWLR